MPLCKLLPAFIMNKITIAMQPSYAEMYLCIISGTALTARKYKESALPPLMFESMCEPLFDPVYFSLCMNMQPFRCNLGEYFM